ncbi:MAG TPA: PhzF family phenazine biosynthesis isomerase [Candidatus Sulfotelmatobacter sp.]|nr:PhzF family phenazine biosynthesis isomerase [Candidatus Sulfotelmatobacter sp.]
MKTFIIDSFTDRPFKGNPAGVCFLEQALSDETMQHIAQELNLSETAFISRLDSPEQFSIRYFSPKMEIPLCGHATLASAKAVFSTYGLPRVYFRNIQGLILAVRMSAGGISMTFPVYETYPAAAPTALLAALGLRSVRNVAYNQETNILLLEIATTEELSNLQPDFAALLRSHDSINGVLVTAPSGRDGYDFHSRYFWPWSGTNEDPVTGGSHTFLAKYWSERLGKMKMKSFQASQRSGFMEVELVDGRVQISSQAVVVFEGEMLATRTSRESPRDLAVC